MKQVPIPLEQAHLLDVLTPELAIQIFGDTICNIDAVADRPPLEEVAHEREIGKLAQNSANFCNSPCMPDVVLRQRARLSPDQAGHWLTRDSEDACVLGRDGSSALFFTRRA